MQISTTNKGNQTKQTIKGNKIKVIGVKTHSKPNRLYPTKSSAIGRIRFKAIRPLLRPLATKTKGIENRSAKGNQMKKLRPIFVSVPGLKKTNANHNQPTQRAIRIERGRGFKISGSFMTSTITQLRDERTSLILMQAIGREGLTPWMASRSTYATEVRSSE